MTKDEVDKLLDVEALPPAPTKYDPKVWEKADFCKTWLLTEANKEDPEAPLLIQPETALVTTRWKDQNSLGVAQLSQFPKGGLEGLFDILDLNLTLPSFANSCSKEGIAISLILYAHYFLVGRWETLFRSFHSQLKKKSVLTLARRLVASWLGQTR